MQKRFVSKGTLPGVGGKGPWTNNQSLLLYSSRGFVGVSCQSSSAACCSAKRCHLPPLSAHATTSSSCAKDESFSAAVRRSSPPMPARELNKAFRIAHSSCLARSREPVISEKECGNISGYLSHKTLATATCLPAKSGWVLLSTGTRRSRVNFTSNNRTILASAEVSVRRWRKVLRTNGWLGCVEDGTGVKWKPHSARG